MFYYNSNLFDPSEDAEVVLEPVAITVKEGANSVSMDRDTYFPFERRVINAGQTVVVMLPDEGLGRVSTHPELEVSHRPETVAQAFLDMNYLPPVIFGRDADRALEDFICEWLEIEPQRSEEDYREVLRELAGIDEEEDDFVDKTKASNLMGEHTYRELQQKAKDLGIDDSRQDKATLAEYVAEHSEE